MSKLEEFEAQLVEVEREIAEKEEFKEYLLKRIKDEKESNQTFTLTANQLHRLLCVLDNSIISQEVSKDKKVRSSLVDIQHELIWDIAEKFNYDMNEGSIDPKTFEFYTFKSRR